MKRFYLSKLVLLFAVIVACSCSLQAQVVTVYSVVGTYTFTVSPSVTSLSIDMAGAQGGTDNAGATGGKGGRVQCTLAVTGGEQLTVYVGGTGTNGSTTPAVNAGGANGVGGGAVGGNGYYYGAGGGGSSDIRLGGTTLANRILVAAGGGGAGQNCNSSNEYGGDGGGLNGGTGWECGTQNGCVAGNGASQSAGGLGSTCYSSTNGTLGAGGGNTYTSWVGGGGGGYYGGGSGQYGGGGGGSSYYGGPGVSAASTTTAYQTGNGYVSITQLCNLPGTISGNVPVCPGANITLTESTSGGSWSSSNPAVATIGSTGVVTAIFPGTTVITYTISNSCGPFTTAIVTVNPIPSPLSTAVMCMGSTATLTDTASGGTWSSSSTGIASVGTGGVVTGNNPGTATITYTLPTGCAMSNSVTVNALPTAYNVTGGGAYCSGGTGVHVGLSSSATGFSYKLFTGGSSVDSVTGTGSAIDFGLYTTAGPYTVVAINLATGCVKNMTGSATVVINPLPAAITGVASACVGKTSTLGDATTGGIWSSSNTGMAMVVPGSGVVTAVYTGTPVISYTLPSTGCVTTTIFTVNPTPGNITGTTSVCAGSTTTLNDAGGGAWSSSNTTIAGIGTNGIVTGYNAGTATITYALATGCYTTTPISINGLPDSTHLVNGGGSYCAGGIGAHVTLSYSNTGINYQLYLSSTPMGSPLPGSNSSLDFGPQTATGTYTVTGTNILTGCSSKMTGSVNVSTIAPPVTYNITGGGNYCAGGTGSGIGLSGSSAGVSYQLYSAGGPVSLPVSGTGGVINFGNFTTIGSYYAIATDLTSGCTQQMTGTTTVSVNPLPIAYNVGGGGTICASAPGVSITLNNSDITSTYTLYLGSVAQVTTGGTGSLINFGIFTAPGTYTVVASNGAFCSNNMTGSATITVNPTPNVYNVTGGGGYCSGMAGTHVGLSFANSGVNYQLWNGPTAIGLPVTGSGASLDFGIISTPGTYTVTAVNPVTACGSNMAGSAVVSINLPPISYNITGDLGTYCAGTSGSAIGTNFSQIGVQYQLYRGGTAVGVPMSGTGTSINFGNFTAGTYTAIATDPVTGCTANISGSATITVNPLPLAYAITGGGIYCVGDTGEHIMLANSQGTVNYELFNNGSSTGIVVPGTGSGIDFGLQTTTGLYTVVGTDATTFCVKNMTGSVTVATNSLPIQYSVIGGGSYCPGGTGLHVGISGSSTGVSYQLFNGSTPTGIALSGTGAPIDFGAKTATGTYTVVGTNATTGCKSAMTGSVSVSLNASPNGWAISAGGSYCAHGAGISLSLPAGSDVGVNYQVYLSTAAVGFPVAGTGGTLNLGTFTAPGLYTVIGTNTSGCSQRMPGSAVINVVTPAVFSVTGGGNFCVGGAGVNVGQSGSSVTETYQLYNNWVSAGAPVTGSGSAINFGLQTTTGSYTIVATNTMYGCVDTMSGNVMVGTNPLPGVNNVTGGGNYCVGSPAPHISLAGSAVGINYQLYLGGVATGLALSGTGSTVDFGAQPSAGAYFVVATNASTHCTDTMAGNVTIALKPTPNPYIVTIDNYGNYCAADSGLHIDVANSDSGITYQLYRNGISVGGAVTGTGSSIDMGLQNIAGNYTIIGTNPASACSSKMRDSVNLYIIPLPAVHDVTGGGGYCQGGNGVDIGLDASDPGIYYQLFDGPYLANGMMGTGAPLDFGMQIALGTYTVIGNSVITNCPNTMYGQAVVSYDTLLTPVVTINAYPGTGIGVWHIDSVRAYASNAGTDPSYQWLINGAAVPGATNASFTNQQFYNNDSITCDVTASGLCGGHTTAASLVLHLANVGVQVITGAAGDIKLMPNPNKGSFTVKGNLGIVTDEEVDMEVVNVIGQVLYTGKIRAQNGNIDQKIELSGNTANGMYLLNLRSASQNMVLHFVIEQ